MPDASDRLTPAAPDDLAAAGVTLWVAAAFDGSLRQASNVAAFVVLAARSS